MNQEPDDQEFEKLRKLLALKRHEQPPPGYFDRLPGKIMARIEATEVKRQRPWWERWFSAPLSQPAVGFAYASLGALLVVGAVAINRNFRSADQATIANPQPVHSVGTPAGPYLVGMETNGTSSPPSFLLQATGEVQRAGFKHQE